jgi:small-conductance mechanosensitive channel
VNFAWRQVRGLEGVVLAVVLALLLPFSAALAQSTPAPAGAGATVQLSDQQLNQIVQAVTGAVLKEVKAAPAAGQAPPTTTPAAAPGRKSDGLEEGVASFLQKEQAHLLDDFETALKGIPGILSGIASIVARIDARPQGQGPLAFLAMVLAAFAAAIALGMLAVAAARRWLPGVAPRGGAASIGETVRHGVASLAGLAVFWLVLSISGRKLFGSPAFGSQDMQAIVGHWLLLAGAQFGLFYTVLTIFFRPSEPAYRIVPLAGPDARVTMRLFAAMAAVMIFRSWIFIAINDGQPEDAVDAGLLLNNLLFVSSFFLAAVPAREAVGRWIENATMGNQVSPFRRWLAGHWLTLAGTAVLILSAVHAFGAVTGRPGVANGLTGSVRAVMVMILVCAAVEFIGRRSERADTAAARRSIPKLPGLASKMLRVFILLGAAIYFVKLWAVDALQMMAPEEWSKLASDAFEPLAALFGGYLAISYVNFLAARYLATHPVMAAKVSEDGTVISGPDESSRLRTLIPIIRITSVVIIIVMTSLLVLSHMGFDITPLLAGASVIGLAISFGSQALVKDIVSGVLFLAEDSFRIGEYIVCGNSSGTVEGFTLRSVRLRHQDGQIFTVPFGQIGEIVNFSRDWSIVKFNMSLDRDVDLDDVRRVTADVAASLKSEFRDRLLDSLKVQGVKDVTDTAIVVRFMFTALPRDPGEIERAARSRLLKAFKENGIALSRHPWLGATTGTAAGAPA